MPPKHYVGGSTPPKSAMLRWSKRLRRQPLKLETTGSNPVRSTKAKRSCKPKGRCMGAATPIGRDTSGRGWVGSFALSGQGGRPIHHIPVGRKDTQRVRHTPP